MKPQFLQRILQCMPAIDAAPQQAVSVIDTRSCWIDPNLRIDLQVLQIDHLSGHASNVNIVSTNT